MENYDEERAKKELQLWIEERSRAEHSKANVCKLLEDTKDIRTFECGTPRAWRLITNANEPEEFVFKMQGILVVSELPPFTKYLGRKSNIASLRQGVTLTGLGIPEFDKAVSGIKIGDLLLKRNLPPQGTETLHCIGEFRGVQTVTISNRYFTPQQHAKGEPAVEIPTEIDPHGTLRRVSRLEYVHTQENTVEYERSQNKEKKSLRSSVLSPF
ncbi:hypothetical protein VNI00_006156 [Paramarasmius palmivorus]|uniref:Uncharacterized protein n=1 Tax=Paramarasmius palmivorus TaxID=297713 RepID=A0AAW0CH14_9AGAR